MVVFVVRVELVLLTVSEAVLQHFREAGVADFEFLLVFEVHKVTFFDGEVPQKLAELKKKYGFKSSVRLMVSTENPFSMRLCICTLNFCSCSSLSKDLTLTCMTSL